MSHQLGFFRDILTNPDDDTPRLVYADWLDDHGESDRAEFIRLQCAAAQASKNSKHRSELEDRAGKLLRKHQQKWAGPLIRRGGMVAFERGFPTPRSCCLVASVLASARNADKLLTIFDRHGPDLHLCELMACLTQEVVFRHAHLVREPTVRRTWSQLRAISHPLTSLPLYLLDVENTRAGHQVVMSSSWDPITPSTASVFFEKLDSPHEVDLIQSAVRPWERESNGIVEVGVYRGSRPVTAYELCAGLLSLVGNETLWAGAHVGFTYPTGVFAILQSAATGGAYTRKCGYPYRRLLAWQSLRGLVGTSTRETWRTVNTIIRRCAWIWFDSDWFHRIFWDIGLVCVRPDHQTIAILAASDTD